MFFTANWTGGTCDKKNNNNKQTTNKQNPCSQASSMTRRRSLVPAALASLTDGRSAVLPQSLKRGSGAGRRPRGRPTALRTGAASSWPRCWRPVCRTPRRACCTAPPCWCRRAWCGAWPTRSCAWRPASPAACGAASSTSTWSWTRAAGAWRASRWTLAWCPRSSWRWCWGRTAGRGPACGTCSSWGAASQCPSSGRRWDSARDSGLSRGNCTRHRPALCSSAEPKRKLVLLHLLLYMLHIYMYRYIDALLILKNWNYRLGMFLMVLFVIGTCHFASVCVRMTVWATGNWKQGCLWVSQECISLLGMFVYVCARALQYNFCMFVSFYILFSPHLQQMHFFNADN